MYLTIIVLLARLAFLNAGRIDGFDLSKKRALRGHLHDTLFTPLNGSEHGSRAQVDETPVIPWNDIEHEIRTQLDEPGVRIVIPWTEIEHEIRTQLHEPEISVVSKGESREHREHIDRSPADSCPRPKAVTKDGYTLSHEGVVKEWYHISRMMRWHLLDISEPTLVEDDSGKITVLPPKKQLFALGHEEEQARVVVDQLCLACDDDTFESNGEVWDCLKHMRKQFDTYVDTRQGMTVRDAAVVLLTFAVSSGAMVASALFPPAAGLGVAAAFGFKTGVHMASVATTTVIEFGIGGKKLTAHVLVDKGTLLLVGVAANGIGAGFEANHLGSLGLMIDKVGKDELHPMARTLGFEKWLANSLLGTEAPEDGDDVAKAVPLVRPLGGLLSILKRRPLHVRSARLQLTSWGQQVQDRVMSKTSRVGVSSLFSALVPRRKLSLHIALLHQHQFDIPASERNDGYKELVDSGYFKELTLDSNLHMTGPSVTLDSPDPAFFGGNIWLAVQMQWRTDLPIPVVANSCAETALPEDLRANSRDPLLQVIPLYGEPYDTNCARIEEVQFPSGHVPVGILELDLQYAPA